MQCFAHTCNDEGDIPAVINSSVAFIDFCSHPISVQNKPHDILKDDVK